MSSLEVMGDSGGAAGAGISPALLQAITERLETTGGATEGIQVATDSMAKAASLVTTSSSGGGGAVPMSLPAFHTSPGSHTALPSDSMVRAAVHGQPFTQPPHQYGDGGAPAGTSLLSPRGPQTSGTGNMAIISPMVTHKQEATSALPQCEQASLLKAKAESNPEPTKQPGDGHLVIKVMADNIKDLGRHSDIMQQLRQKLGSKIVIQLETPQGTVLLQPDDQSPASTPHVENPEDKIASHITDMSGMGSEVVVMSGREGQEGGEPMMEGEETVQYQGGEGGLMVGEEGGRGEGPPSVDNIVTSVVSTIRTLTAKLGKEEYKECPICRDKISGFHYGVQTCESCKGFFKRTVQNKKTFTCHRSGDCDVFLTTRKKCPGCRFRKCLEIGMKVEGIRNDRSRGGRSSYDGASIPRRRSGSFSTPKPPGKKRMSCTYEGAPGSNAPSTTSSVASPGFEATYVNPQLYRTPYTQPVIPQLIQDIYALENLYEEPDDKPQACCLQRLTSGDYHKFNSMLHITEHRLYQIVRWARNLPNFLNIHTDDQILLLQNSWAELVCLGAVWRSRQTPGTIQLSFGKTIDMKKAKEMEHEECITRMLRVCDHFNRLRVDRYEYVCLKVLTLMLPDIKSLKEAETIQDYQNQLVDALLIYTSSHFPDVPTKFGEMLIRLSEVQRLTAITRSQILQKHAAGEVCEYGLLMELLRGQGQQGSNPSGFANMGAAANQGQEMIHSTTTDPVTVEPGTPREGTPTTTSAPAVTEMQWS